MIDISAISTNLSQDASGIWIAKSQRDISYPDDGNQACFTLEDSSYWFRHRNDVIAQLVKTYSPNTTFFDIGGGNGCVSYALQCHGMDVALLEPGFESRKLNRMVRSKNLESYKRNAVSWANHLVPEATRIKLLLEQEILRGDTPTQWLETDWRERMEDASWALLNSPEFMFVP